MSKTGKASSSHPIALSGYRKESLRPLVCLAFVAPMLVAYESAMLITGPQAMRNGADVWLRELLKWIGFGQYFLLPGLTCAVLLGWHHMARQTWTVRWAVLPVMLVESLLFAATLVAVAQFQRQLFSSYLLSTAGALDADLAGSTSRLVAYFGAGIYEELLFRLMLLPVVIGGVRLLGVSTPASFIWGVVLTSLFFSAAHYQVVTIHGDPFEWFSFSFRFLAGVFFSILFLARGFGVAVGTHALYDILVVVL